MASPFEFQMLELPAASKPLPPNRFGLPRSDVSGDAVTSSGGKSALATYLFVTGITAQAMASLYRFNIGFCA